MRHIRPKTVFRLMNINTKFSSLTKKQEPSRSCTKVQKQGNALARALNLKKFNDYAKIIREPKQLFNMAGGS